MDKIIAGYWLKAKIKDKKNYSCYEAIKGDQSYFLE
jgi:hypothetical protein